MELQGLKEILGSRDPLVQLENEVLKAMKDQEDFLGRWVHQDYQERTV